MIHILFNFLGLAGGGPPSEVIFTPAELIALGLLSPTANVGLPAADSEGDPLRKLTPKMKYIMQMMTILKILAREDN